MFRYRNKWLLESGYREAIEEWWRKCIKLVDIKKLIRKLAYCGHELIA